MYIVHCAVYTVHCVRSGLGRSWIFSIIYHRINFRILINRGAFYFFVVTGLPNNFCLHLEALLFK